MIQLRKHARSLAAIVFLVIAGLAIGGYILSNQRFYAPGWVPLIGALALVAYRMRRPDGRTRFASAV